MDMIKNLDYYQHISFGEQYMAQCLFEIDLVDACEDGNLSLIESWFNDSSLNEYINIDPIIKKNFSEICGKSNLDIIKKILSTSKLINILDIQCAFEVACATGKMDMIQYLLFSPEIKIHAHIHNNNGDCLRMACGRGQLNVLKYLLQSIVPEQENNIKYNSALEAACMFGHMEVVEYLLTSPFKNKFDIHADKDNLLNMIAMRDNVEILKFLLTSPKLSDKQKDFRHIDVTFNCAILYDAKNTINYLIFEQNMPLTDDIREFLYDHQSTGNYVLNLFEKRELNKKLNNSLAINVKRNSNSKV